MPSLRVISFQVSPPSVDLKSPDRGPPLDMYDGPRRACQIAAYRMRGLAGSMARSIAPAESERNRILSQVLPPSFERNTPRSGFGSDGATSMAPIEPARKYLSEIGAQVRPPSLVFQTPPPVPPK